MTCERWRLAGTCLARPSPSGQTRPFPDPHCACFREETQSSARALGKHPPTQFGPTDGCSERIPRTPGEQHLAWVADGQAIGRGGATPRGHGGTPRGAAGGGSATPHGDTAVSKHGSTKDVSPMPSVRGEKGAASPSRGLVVPVTASSSSSRLLQLPEVSGGGSSSWKLQGQAVVVQTPPEDASKHESVCLPLPPRGVARAIRELMHFSPTLCGATG